ncbi:hypothetical protein KAU11_09375 [Candidatus Babeliales bacterium]|nr:hypothetical protein [Candidatus Babeliales bacterium]
MNIIYYIKDRWFRGKGIVKARKSKKDYIYEEHFKISGSSEFETVDLRSTSSRVRDQRDTQFCVSFGVGSRLARLMREVSGQSFRIVSVLYNHYYTRLKHGWADENKGVSIKYYLDSLFKKGFVYEGAMSFKKPYLRKPMHEDDVLAQFVRARYLKDYEYYLIQSKNVREALKDGYTVIYGLELNNSFYGNTDGYTDNSKPNGYNHCMELEGFIDEERVHISKNSWGIWRGDKGYYYIPYEYFENNAFDCYVVRKK